MKHTQLAACEIYISYCGCNIPMNSLNIKSDVFYNNKKLSKFVPATIRGIYMMKHLSVPVTSYQSNLLGETEIWQVFSRQSPAIDYANKTGMGVMVFAYESKTLGEKGKRNFVVAHPKKLWVILKGRPISFRCTYEVIREDDICKLYFDLEFSIALNPNINGCKIIQTFVLIVNYYLKKVFNIITEFEDVLILDSTTEKKFSRHLIYNSRFSFINNRHAGSFVTFVCEQLRCMQQKNSCDITDADIHLKDVNELFVKNDSNNLILFCDESVYTKNRNFRTYNSTKISSQALLTLSSDNRYVPLKGSDEENYFFDSLITHIAEPKMNRIVQFEPGAKSFAISDTNSKLHSNEFNNYASNQSPYPQIDKFIEGLHGEGSIRSLQYREKELLVFDIKRTFRFCHNINREHKSNGIMYIVNLKKGIYYQKCHDPECKYFKSIEWWLPSNVFEFYNINDIADVGSSSSSVDEDKLLIDAVTKAEIMDKMEQHYQRVESFITDNCDYAEKSYKNSKNMKVSNHTAADLFYVSDEELIEAAQFCEQQMINQ